MSTTQEAVGRMCWMPQFSSGGKNILHLYVGERWVPYTAAPQYSEPDYTVPSGSLGYATMQKLLKAGWEIVPAPYDEQ